MSVAFVTGSAGLIGSAAAHHFAALGLDVVGIDNDMRRYFFGPDGTTIPNAFKLIQDLGPAYTHLEHDIRDRDALGKVMARYGRDIAVVVHAAGQPSHDWAVREPLTDFDVNAVGTINMLEHTRRHCPDAAFIFTSTNKVYGDLPNQLPLVEHKTRWEIEAGHEYEAGITEAMPIDSCLHSIFGVGKVAADIAVQEYSRYFGLSTATFRCGTLTGPAHTAAELHGFLAYLMRCAMEGRTYRIFGYGGKQVRDAIHSQDLVAAFEAFFRAPRQGEIYNMGGGRHPHTSLTEAVTLAEKVTGESMSPSTTRTTESATTSGGSAPPRSSPPTTRPGRTPTTCRRSWPRCTRRTPRRGSGGNEGLVLRGGQEAGDDLRVRGAELQRRDRGRVDEPHRCALPAHHVLVGGVGGRVEDGELADRAGELRRRRESLPEQVQFLDLERGFFEQLPVGTVERVLAGVDVSAGQAPAVRVDPSVAVAQLQQQPSDPVDQDHPGDPGIHLRTHDQAA